jgi:hypothetical protein
MTIMERKGAKMNLCTTHESMGKGEENFPGRRRRKNLGDGTW